MNKNVLLWLIVIGCSLGVSMGMLDENRIENKNSTAAVIAADHGTKTLSRHKRYMAFPEGSSLSVSIIISCVGIMVFIGTKWLKRI